MFPTILKNAWSVFFPLVPPFAIGGHEESGQKVETVTRSTREPRWPRRGFGDGGVPQEREGRPLEPPRRRRDPRVPTPRRDAPSADTPLTGCARCNPKKLAKYLDKKRRRAEEEGIDPEQVKLPCWARRGTAKAEGKRRKGGSGASEGKKKKKKKRRKKVQVSRAPEGTKKRKKKPLKKKDEPKPKGGKVGVLWSPGHGKEGRFYYGGSSNTTRPRGSTRSATTTGRFRCV